MHNPGLDPEPKMSLKRHYWGGWQNLIMGSMSDNSIFYILDFLNLVIVLWLGKRMSLF